MREAASDVCSIAHERAATKQTARQAAAHPGFDDMAPSAVLLALRICESYSTRLAPCIQGHLVRNAAHEGFCISLHSTRAGEGEHGCRGAVEQLWRRVQRLWRAAPRATCRAEAAPTDRLRCMRSRLPMTWWRNALPAAAALPDAILATMLRCSRVKNGSAPGCASACRRYRFSSLTRRR